MLKFDLEHYVKVLHHETDLEEVKREMSLLLDITKRLSLDEEKPDETIEAPPFRKVSEGLGV